MALAQRRHIVARQQLTTARLFPALLEQQVSQMAPA